MSRLIRVSAQQMLWTLLADQVAVLRQHLYYLYQKRCPIPTPISVMFHGLLMPFPSSYGDKQLPKFVVVFGDYNYFFI